MEYRNVILLLIKYIINVVLLFLAVNYLKKAIKGKIEESKNNLLICLIFGVLWSFSLFIPEII